MLWLGVVGIAATAIVRSFIAIIDRLGAPEFVASTLVLALGTSLPELVVDWTAIRRGAAALAIGDLFGSSLVDSTLSVGIGPVVRGVAVSDEALIGTLLIAGGVALATITVAVAHRRATLVGALAAIYAVTMGAVVALAA
jgi:cation:H+ antiporter